MDLSLQRETESEYASAGAKTRPGSGAMFDTIARRYDLMNRLLSFGVDRGWRKRAVAALSPPLESIILDLACGTGDVTLELLRRYPTARVIGVDPSPAMLELAKKKLAAGGVDGRTELREGIGEALPLDDRSVDGATMAFGIRNVPDRRAALKELGRVTKPGGKIAILELTEPQSGPLAKMARFHIHWLLPRMGALLSGEKEYRYLHESIAAFPSPEVFAVELEQAGLKVLSTQPLSFGAACLWVATPGPHSR